MHWYKKLYVWSLVLEPMLFFVAGHRDHTIITANISRILQLIFLIYIATGGVKFENFFLKRKFKYFWFSLYFSIISGVLGIVLGYYDGLSAQSPYLIYTIHPAIIRSFLEYIIFIYYFVYFVIFFSVFIRSKEEFDFFFKIFKLMFFTSIIVGTVDYVVYPIFGVDLVTRHLYDFNSSGYRFHGLFGEPRDAFINLGIGLGIYYVMCIHSNKKTNKFILLSIIICMYLTKSTSGMMGLIFFGVMIQFVLIFHKKIKSSMYLFIISMLMISSFIILTPRLQIHTKHMSVDTVSKVYNKEIEVPESFKGQMSNIYPIFWIYEGLVQLDINRLLMGGGLGMSSIVNQKYLGEYTVSNPNAFIIKLLGDLGLIGSIMFFFSLYYPVLKTHIPQRKIKRNIIVLSVFAIGLLLAHKGAAPYIFIGLVISYFRAKGQVR